MTTGTYAILAILILTLYFLGGLIHVTIGFKEFFKNFMRTGRGKTEQ